MRSKFLIPLVVVAVASFGIQPQVALADSRPPDLLGVRVAARGGDGATGTIRSTTKTSGSSSGGSVSRGVAQRPSANAGRAPAVASGPRLTAAQHLFAQRKLLAADLSTGGSGTTILGPALPGAPAGPAAARPAAAGAPAVVVDPAVLAREAAATLRLPAQTVRIGPDPSLNRWNMLAVGYPLWLWRDGADTVTESVNLGGATLTLTANYLSTTYAMGDGTTVTCAQGTPWVAGAQPPGTPSPTCGHSYSRPGTYTITANHAWQLSWSGLGQSGSFPLSNVSSSTLEIGEIASVVVGR